MFSNLPASDWPSPLIASCISLMAALCEGFDEVIPAWLDATLVTQVVATGPVPSFAPPEVPGGPVVGGSAAMLRGGGFF